MIFSTSWLAHCNSKLENIAISVTFCCQNLVKKFYKNLHEDIKNIIIVIIIVIVTIVKHRSRGAVHADKSLRLSVKRLLKYFVRAINISAYSNIMSQSPLLQCLNKLKNRIL